VSSFAQEDIPNKYIFIEGTASRLGHYEFFLTNFRKEAVGAGYIVTDSKEEAAHTLKFVVTPSVVVDYGSSAMTQAAEMDGDQYLIKISLFRNYDDFEVLVFDFFFFFFDEMYGSTRTLF
jgi:hypothetical protein